MNYLSKTIDGLREQCPDCEPELLDLYTLLALTKGTATTMSDVHVAWAIWCCATRPDHHSLVPFDELPKVVQEIDRPWMEAIHRAAAAT